ncbi:thiolase family protein [Nocardioides zeae]|uniref:Thiolase family protein n=1 Tax=Nocardioides imazamoxiresistens TaxID=3231893 RepID=A0ABU3PR03_9ACTN|nr:thiolase family protein [Nocardioides zeae]MDT9591664.1 thiolase family protein [Nocardioides zeae]
MSGALTGRSAVLVGATRTPIGRGHPEKGVLRDEHPAALLGRAYRGLLDQVGLDAALVDDVVAGCGQQLGEQSANVARNAWLHEGLPVTTAATTVDRACGSSQQAVNVAAALVASGSADVVVGAGVEHMGRIPFAAGPDVQERWGSPFTPQLLGHFPLVGQGEAAECISDDHGLTRAEMDELAERSHRLAVRAVAEGRFDAEITPVETAAGTVRQDQGVRPDTDAAALAGLRPAFRPDGRLTAGNSSQISDGAAAVLVAEEQWARDRGLPVRARVLDALTVGCDPVRMLEGPIPATRRVLERNGMTVDDVDLFEVNEAFAAIVLAWEREVKADRDKVNVNGGAIALGHPLGASGARLLTTLLHELERSDKEIGLVTMCCGGGLGTATLVQRVG